MGTKKLLLKISPYVVSIIVGFIFYQIGVKLSGDVKGLVMGISGAFITIPLVYFFYQAAHDFSKRKLNKQIFDYAKMQIDREILSIVNQLLKIVYLLEEKNLSPKGVSSFLSLGKDAIKEEISKRKYLGFQVFKNWEATENKLHEILKNPYILDGLDNEQIKSVISIVGSLRDLESIQKTRGLYIDTGKKTTSYKIVYGKKLNERNVDFPDRYLLLKDLGDGKSLVDDFGDIPLYNVDKVLHIFKVNEKYLEMYAHLIFNLITEINKWLDLTGEEFIIDTKMFRPSGS